MLLNWTVIIFAVMPYGWFFRRIFLETIQVPFLLTSILLAVYLKDLKIVEKRRTITAGTTILSDTKLLLWFYFRVHF